MLKLLLFISALFLYSNFKAAEKPNFIIIFIDDQGYQDLGCFGSPNIKTPNIDAMAKSGAKFTNFHVAASVCSPSRASLLTGRYPERTGVKGVLFPRHDSGLHPREVTIAETLKKAGYSTAAVGKWHLGHRKPFLPTNQGFDSYYGIPYSNDMGHDPTMDVAENCLFREGKSKEMFKKGKSTKNLVPLFQDEKVIEYPADQNTLTSRFTEKALEFIEANNSKPFFLYLAHTMPHVPLYVSKEFEGKSDAGLYGDCIEEIDHGVGKIIKKLKDLGIDKNTFIVYTSDNGPWDFKGDDKFRVKGNMNRRVGGSALPLKGAKFSSWEGGIRVPTVMHYPAKIPAGMVNDQLCSTIDLLPTIAKLAGVELDSEREIDGMDISSLLIQSNSPVREIFHIRTQAVIKGNWKLHKNELFNLKDDISESKNVAKSNPQIVEELKQLLQAHKKNLSKDASKLTSEKDL